MENDVKEIFDKIKKITSSVKPAVLEVPLFDPKSMIKKIDFPEIDFQDNVLFQMENNQILHFLLSFLYIHIPLVIALKM